jgi:hypothetical protein
MARGLHKEWATPLGSVTMAHRSRFEERLLAILDPRVARKAASSRFVLVAGLGASPLVLSLALAVPTAATLPSSGRHRRSWSAVPPPRRGAARNPETPDPPEPPEQPAQPEQKERERPQTAEERAAREVAKTALAEALDDPEASVREQALNALVHMGDSSVAPYLEKALTDESPGARAQAAWGLGAMRRRSAESLVGAPRRRRGSPRASGLGLGMIRAASSVTGSSGRFGWDDDVRSQTAWALGMIRPRAVAGLNGVRDAEEAFANSGLSYRDPQSESVDGLVGALGSSRKFSQAAWALGMIRDSRAVRPLSRALKDEDRAFDNQPGRSGLSRRAKKTTTTWIWIWIWIWIWGLLNPAPPNPGSEPRRPDVDNTPRARQRPFTSGHLRNAAIPGGRARWLRRGPAGSAWR